MTLTGHPGGPQKDCSDSLTTASVGSAQQLSPYNLINFKAKLFCPELTFIK